MDNSTQKSSNGWGGKRNGAGSKPGNQNAAKRRHLTEYADQMVALAEKLLFSKNRKEQMWAFKELLPYVFRKQPQEITGEGGGPIQFQEIRTHLFSKIHRLTEVEEAQAN